MNFHSLNFRPDTGSGILATAVTRELEAALQRAERPTRRMLRPALGNLADVLADTDRMPIPSDGVFLAVANHHYGVGAVLEHWPDERGLQNLATLGISKPAQWDVINNCVDDAHAAIECQRPDARDHGNSLMLATLTALSASDRAHLQRELIIEEFREQRPLAILIAALAASRRGKSAGCIFGGVIPAWGGLAADSNCWTCH